MPATARSNIEGGGVTWRANYIDPMIVEGIRRDPFPKADVLGGYIGDGYPLCIDLPNKQFLRKGATYRMNGSHAKADLDKDPAGWANVSVDKQIRRLWHDVLTNIINIFIITVGWQTGLQS